MEVPHSLLLGGGADIPFPEGSFVMCFKALTISMMSPENPTSMNRSKGDKETAENMNISDNHSNSIVHSL